MTPKTMTLFRSTALMAPDEGGAPAGAEPAAAAAAPAAAATETVVEPTLMGGPAETDTSAADAATAAAAEAAKAKTPDVKTGALADDNKPEADKPADETPEAKATREAAEAAAKAKTDAEDPEVPEGTAFTLKAPEGFEGLDEAALTKAQPLLRELGVKTNGQAQKVIDSFAKEVLPDMISRALTQQSASFDQMVATTRKEWADATRADKEIGGAPETLNANVATALRFRDRFGTPALTELLNASGIGNHPEVVRLFLKAGKAISEGSFHVSDGSAQVKGTVESRMYGPEFQPKS